MEEQAASRDKSSDSIATSEEFEDLGSAPKNGETTKVEGKVDLPSALLDKDASPEEHESSPEIEIRNNGNMASLQETLIEALDDETRSTSTGIHYWLFYDLVNSML